MESPNQRISQARANRIPLFFFLGFCTVVVGLGAYASYQRSASNTQKHGNERSFTPDMEYGYTMSKKLSEVQDVTPVTLTINPDDHNNDSADFWQQYLAYLQQYDTPAEPEPPAPVEPAPPEPTPREPCPEDVPVTNVDAPLSPEEQLQLQLRQQRANALLQALRSSATVGGSNSANTALAQKTNYSHGNAGNHSNTAYGTDGNAAYANNSNGTGISNGTGNSSYNTALSPQQQQALQQGQQQLRYPAATQDLDNSGMGGAGGYGGNGYGNGVAGERGGAGAGIGNGAYASYGGGNPNAMQGLSAYQSLANNDTLLNTRMETVLSPFLLRQGALLPCVLMTGINSDLPGLVQAQVTQDVFDSPLGQHLLIPRGSKVIGQYASAPLMGQKRLMLAFNRVIFPDGKAMNLGAMPGGSPDGYAGFDAEVNTHFWQLMGNAILLGGVSAGIAISVDDGTRDENGNLTLNGALTQGLGQSLGRVLTNVIERNMTTSPTLNVQPGFVFNVTLTKDIYFPSAYHAYSY